MTLLDYIEAFRDAKKAILGYYANQHSRHDMIQSQTTFTCNVVSDDAFFRGCSTDFGYSVQSFGDRNSFKSSDYASKEKKLDIDDNNTYFDTTDDNDDKIDDCYDDKIYLL